MTHCILANPHDRGYDIVAGSDITGRRIGVVYMDDDGFGNAGLVLRLDVDDGEYMPDSGADAQEILADYAYHLSPEDVQTLSEMIRLEMIRRAR